VSKEKGQYWQFALVEKPDNDKNWPKGHFIELKCMKDKVWGNHRGLKSPVYKRHAWKYGETYTMTIKVAAARIDGILKNKAGEVVGHIAYTP
jgi:hypothetical protein